MTVKEHYENHLGNFYSWMAGDFETKQKEFSDFLKTNNISLSPSGVAIDLGAGHGIQSVALAKLGFKVTAIDFNPQLLNELKNNTKDLSVEILEEDIRSIANHKDLKPGLIVCWGDTLTHLDNVYEIEDLLAECYQILSPGGKLILSFRDYSEKLSGNKRFIPVKSDAKRILTCMLEYTPTHVTINDLLHEFNGQTWEQKISSYNKVRISAMEVEDVLTTCGMNILLSQTVNGMVTMIAEK
jgi:2-polyprenyl-3-methyl-5-hydroxy-6-metoxy-1,4-benzoquinol methylase